MRVAFNNEMSKCTNKEDNIGEFCKTIVNAGKTELAKDDNIDQGWYDLSKDSLRPIIKSRNNLLFKVASSDIKDP